MAEFATRLGENASGLPDASPVPVLAPQATPVPTNPAVILAAQQPASKKDSRRFWLYVGGGIIVGQLILPTDIKPVSLAGSIGSAFSLPYLEQSARVQIDVETQRALAQRLAQLRGEYSDAVGFCSLAGVLGPEAAQICRAGVDMRFLPSIREAETALRRR